MLRLSLPPFHLFPPTLRVPVAPQLPSARIFLFCSLGGNPSPSRGNTAASVTPLLVWGEELLSRSLTVAVQMEAGLDHNVR